MNTAEIIVRRLEAAGVRWVFGIPSGPVLPLIDALRQSTIEFVLTTNETSAGFMATVVGQLTGSPGVCVATVGPGATNLTTGVGAAWLDRAPCLAITCNVATPWLNRRIQMRIDHHALFRPLSKDTVALTAANADLALQEAIALACAEPPGPVHLDLPEDVAVAPAAQGAPPLHERAPKPADISATVEGVLQKALAESRRALLITGLSVNRSRLAQPLRRFVEAHGIPFISTLHGKGLLPESHPLWCGVLGRARRTTVQALVKRADLVIAIGYDPIEINYEEWLGDTPLVHVDYEAADISASVNTLLNVGGDMDGAVERMAAMPPSGNDWTAAELDTHRRTLESALRPPMGGDLATYHVLDALRARLPADGILAYDVGAHTHQIATQWRTDQPLTCLATNGWSSMGFGMPAAYAAKLVFPDRAVACVVGDGGFLMTAGELSLARRMNLAVPTVVLNDGWLGLMKVKQERRGYQLSGVHLGEPPSSPPHYFGVPCRSARTLDELHAALDWGLTLDGPSVIEAFVTVEPYSETVYD
ncbi:MAG: thiamine pyrophosphate-binding protein [Chloroflexi bacterium]|nr:thiamine pyrophosphate-binding protein [Chloroflexota bacterium]